MSDWKPQDECRDCWGGEKGIDSMIAAPKSIHTAKVVCFSPIDERHAHTGGCRHSVAGMLQGPAAGLAICQSDGEGFYLFGCDADWNIVTDTWHETIDEAMRQAEFEYAGVSKTWQKHE